MILHHIHYKMPIYKDCTLAELLLMGSMTFIVLSIGLATLTKLFFGFAWIGFALAILLLVHATRFLLGRLQKIKYGKPYGYYKHLFIQKSQNNIVFKQAIQSRYVQRQGKWSVRRMS